MHSPAYDDNDKSVSAARLQIATPATAVANQQQHGRRLGGGINNLQLPNAATPTATAETPTAAAPAAATSNDTNKFRNNWPPTAATTATTRLLGGGMRRTQQQPQQPMVLFVGGDEQTNTIVVPASGGIVDALRTAAVNARDKWRAFVQFIRQSLEQQKPKKNARQAVPFKKRLKRAAMRQYRRWFKPAELIFYVGQRSNPVFPFQLDDSKTTYAYATRDMFNIYAGIAGIVFGCLWCYLQLISSPLDPTDTIDTAAFQVFLQAATVLASLWLVLGEIHAQRIVIDTSCNMVRCYKHGMKHSEARYETSFVRLRRALASADVMAFYLVFGARNFPEVSLSNKTKNARVLRALGRALAKTLQANYFDFTDLSIHHVPRIPHFAADLDWTHEMLCMTYTFKQRQAELDQQSRETRRSMRLSSAEFNNPSNIIAAEVDGTLFSRQQAQTNNSVLEAASSVCLLNVHRLPDTVVDVFTLPSQPVADETPTTPSALRLRDSRKINDQTVSSMSKRRPQILAQPRQTATAIKRPANLAHPLLPSDALSRPHVDDSLVSLSRMVVSPASDSNQNAQHSKEQDARRMSP